MALLAGLNDATLRPAMGRPDATALPGAPDLPTELGTFDLPTELGSFDLPTELGSFDLATELAAPGLRPAVADAAPATPGGPVDAPAPKPAGQLIGSLVLSATTLAAVTVLLMVANVVAVPGTRHVFDHGEQFVVIGATLALVAGIAATLSLLQRASNGVVLAAATAIGITATTVLLASGVSVVKAAAARYVDQRTPAVPQSATHPGSGRTGAWNDAGDASGTPTPTGSPSPSNPVSPSASVTASSPAATPTSPAAKAPDGRNPYLITAQNTLLMDRQLGTGTDWSDDEAAVDGCAPAAAGLQVTATAASDPHGCLLPATRLTDATVEVTMRLGASASAGILVRRTAAGTWYAAGLDASGRAWLAPVTAGTIGARVVDKAVPGFAATTQHVLAVAAVGSTLTLHVDHVPVGATVTGGVAAGQVGVFAAMAPSGGATPASTATATAQRIRIWTE